jgi:hypothetical protein
MIRNKIGLRVVRLNRRKAIRYFCAECAGRDTNEIEKCNGMYLDGSMCSFHSFGSGKGKQVAMKRDAAIKNQCRYCMQVNSISIRNCTSQYCPVYPYRNHKTDSTCVYPASWPDDEIINSGLPK